MFLKRTNSAETAPCTHLPYRLFALISLLAILQSPLAQGVTALTVGAAATEEGDDRQRPAVYIAGVFGDQYFAKSYLYGRTFNRVTEQTVTLSVGKRFGIFNANFLKAGLGVTASNDSTRIEASETEPAESENAGNFGALFNIHISPPLAQNMTLEAGWDTHLFAAGAAGLFLATGRKQMLYLGAGMSF